ncbi:hypothetical protein [Flavobacterium silvaticum]|uniref:Uncharacterized protein n=1 Tax=Flavobacterium silvaticum TaxID=1852020 RepID=A0A972FKE2_9FLAO|nr:hypothetical protein [Flavobacterium silvaticum]NMH26845.1 hypothetical protein [Flavobacterium silvaticum]
MWRAWSVVFTLFLITRPLFPLVDYAVNYNYISTVLCENKAKPELKCNGKCHLMKELANAADAEKSSSEPAKKIPSLTELFCDISTVSIGYHPLFTESAPHRFAYSNSYLFSASDTVFHPPAV